MFDPTRPAVLAVASWLAVGCSRLWSRRRLGYGVWLLGFAGLRVRDGLFGPDFLDTSPQNA